MLLFHSAREWGFLGIAVYAAFWFFMFPLMLVGSLAVGLFVLWTERQAEKRAREPLIETRPNLRHAARSATQSRRQGYRPRRRRVALDGKLERLGGHVGDADGGLDLALAHLRRRAGVIP
jgi:hypothetical protein